MEGDAIPVKTTWRIVTAAAVVAAAGLLMLPASSIYYRSTAGEGCARCHEIRETYNTWRASSHRGVACAECHGDALSGGIASSVANFRRAVKHVRGEIPEQVRMRGLDVYKMMERCRGCHRQEFADWQSGPHSSTFSALLLDQKHNSQRLLMDDCLRCHGAFFEGGIKDLVTPVNTAGPWKIAQPEWASLPAIPCLACHEMHREGEPLRGAWKRGTNKPSAEEINRPSLAHFDRRSMMHVAARDLAIPAMLDGSRAVRMSPDTRQALCYQCHAPVATRQVGSGDDRTGMGVHEGISCLACHQKHGQGTRASCATCHPRLSNCGLDVEKMDTTYKSASSKHNVHFVKCEDCHTKGVPKRKNRDINAARVAGNLSNARQQDRQGE